MKDFGFEVEKNAELIEALNYTSPASHLGWDSGIISGCFYSVSHDVSFRWAMMPSGGRQCCPKLKWLLAGLLWALEEETGALCSFCPGKWIAGDIKRSVFASRISMLSPGFLWCLFGSCFLPLASFGIWTPPGYDLMHKTTNIHNFGEYRLNTW